MKYPNIKLCSSNIYSTLDIYLLKSLAEILFLAQEIRKKLGKKSLTKIIISNKDGERNNKIFRNFVIESFSYSKKKIT